MDPLADDPRLEPYLKALGRITASWAALETSINLAIWELANVEQHAGACITAQILSPGGRYKAYISLVMLRAGDKAIYDALNAHSSHYDGLARQRNHFVHDAWGVDQQTGVVARFETTAERKLEFGFRPQSLQQILDLDVEIIAATDRFRELHQMARDTLPAWPRTQFEQSEGPHYLLSTESPSERKPGLPRPHGSSRE